MKTNVVDFSRYFREKRKAADGGEMTQAEDYDVLRDDEKKQRIEKAIRNAAASAAMEGLYCTPEEIELIRKKLSDEISNEEFMERVLALAEKEGLKGV